MAIAILVCTNGLTDALDAQVIGAMLGTDQTRDQQCAELLAAVQEVDGADDATAVVSHFVVPK